MTKELTIHCDEHKENPLLIWQTDNDPIELQISLINKRENIHADFILSHMTAIELRDFLNEVLNDT